MVGVLKQPEEEEFWDVLVFVHVQLNKAIHTFIHIQPNKSQVQKLFKPEAKLGTLKLF